MTTRTTSGVRAPFEAIDQAAVPAVAPTLVTQGVAVASSAPGAVNVLQERAAFIWDAAAGGEAWRLYGWYDGGWKLMELGTTPAVAETYIQSYLIAPRPERVCIMGPAGITNVKHLFSE